MHLGLYWPLIGVNPWSPRRVARIKNTMADCEIDSDELAPPPSATG
jgi:hypothetical protein